MSGLGQAAWQGNADGPANKTVGVLLADYSFRIDTTYEYRYEDLKGLAAIVAPRIK